MSKIENIKQKSYHELPHLVQAHLKKINKNDPTPLYHQLLQTLTSVLEENTLSAGSFFATESLLQEFTGLSRSTIRRAIEELVKIGSLIRITGKGTFVSVKIPEDHLVLPRFKSLTQDLIDRGMKPGTIVLNSSFTKPQDRVVKVFGAADDVLMTERVRTGNEVPILYLTSYIPKSIGLTAQNLLLDSLPDSLYELLEKYNKFPESAVHTIKATIIEKDIAYHLGVKAKSAGLWMQRTTFDDNRTPILYEEGFFRGDLYSYTFRMQN